MEAITQLKYLRVLNHLNMDQAFIKQQITKDQRADIIVAKAMTEFLRKYEFEIKKKYTFVVDYKNDVFSFIALRICHGAVAAMRRTIDIRILGDLNAKEKEFLKDFPTISYRKAKKLKQCVLITGFNPILNVENETALSKDFIEIYHPIARITPEILNSIMNFYLNKDSFLYLKGMDKTAWTDFYKEPVAMTKNFENMNTLWFPRSINDVYNKSCDFQIPLIHFILSGTEEDFDTYDIIMKSAKEGNIHLYTIEGDKSNVDFVISNLAPYIEARNVPQDINIVTEERAKEILECIDVSRESFTVSWRAVKDYGVDKILEELGGNENEDSSN